MTRPGAGRGAALLLEDPLAPIWPGVTVPRPGPGGVRRADRPARRAGAPSAAVAGLRRLDQADWLTWDETADTIRLGPRVAPWSTSDLSTLRQLWRSMPGPACCGASRPAGASRTPESLMTSIFEPVLADLGERQRDEILAAFAAVEHSPEPVPEAVAPGLRDATLRRSVAEMLHLIGRTLVRAGPGRWTSGTGTTWPPADRGGGNPLP